MLTGEELRFLRTLRGLKRKTMAKRFNISQPAYCKIEKAKSISGEKPVKILSIPGYSLQELETLKKIIGGILL